MFVSEITNTTISVDALKFVIVLDICYIGHVIYFLLDKLPPC